MGLPCLLTELSNKAGDLLNKYFIPKKPEDAGFSEFDWCCDRGVPL